MNTLFNLWIVTEAPVKDTGEVKIIIPEDWEERIKTVDEWGMGFSLDVYGRNLTFREILDELGVRIEGNGLDSVLDRKIQDSYKAQSEPTDFEPLTLEDVKSIEEESRKIERMKTLHLMASEGDLDLGELNEVAEIFLGKYLQAFTV